MALTREKKVSIFDSFKNILGNVSSAVFVRFSGLSGQDATDLRRALKSEGIAYKVVKKTLFDRALADSSVSGSAPALDGEIAIAYPVDGTSEDTTAAARGVYAFEKKLDGKLAIVGGFFDRSFRDQAGMLEIATIPSQDVLRGMFVNVINAPLQGFAVALKAIADKKGA